jgi:hypothetical protein
MPQLLRRATALLAAGATAATIAACSDRNENQSNEGPESDEPSATVQTNTEGLGPSKTETEPNVTQPQRPLTQTTK